MSAIRPLSNKLKLTKIYPASFDMLPTVGVKYKMDSDGEVEHVEHESIHNEDCKQVIHIHCKPLLENETIISVPT